MKLELDIDTDPAGDWTVTVSDPVNGRRYSVVRPECQDALRIAVKHAEFAVWFGQLEQTA